MVDLHFNVNNSFIEVCFYNYYLLVTLSRRIKIMSNKNLNSIRNKYSTAKVRKLEEHSGRASSRRTKVAN